MDEVERILTTQRYRNQPEEATPERSTQHNKQPPHKHGMMHKQL